MHDHEADIDVKIGIVTVSTSRFDKYGNLRGIEKIGDFDESGKLIYETFEEGVVDYVLVPDDEEEIKRGVQTVLEKADVCITTGGTGVSPTDVTIEAVRQLFTKELEGFGDIFRMLSYSEIGVSAILSRATAGMIGEKVVFCLPGSKKAVKLALSLVKPLLKHLVSHAKGLA